MYTKISEQISLIVLLTVGLAMLCVGMAGATVVITDLAGEGTIYSETIGPNARLLVSGTGEHVLYVSMECTNNSTDIEADINFIPKIPDRTNRYEGAAWSPGIGLHNLQMRSLGDASISTILSGDDDQINTDQQFDVGAAWLRSVVYVPGAPGGGLIDDLAITFAEGNLSGAIGVEDMRPPEAGEEGDWLPCLGMLDYPVWTEYGDVWDGDGENETEEYFEGDEIVIG